MSRGVRATCRSGLAAVAVILALGVVGAVTVGCATGRSADRDAGVRRDAAGADAPVPLGTDAPIAPGTDAPVTPGAPSMSTRRSSRTRAGLSWAARKNPS